MNRNYVRGRAHEYAIKKKWEKDGWTVLRTAGSHGFVDLIAIKRYDDHGLSAIKGSGWSEDGDIVFIQAKSGKSAEKEKAKLESLKDKWGGLYSVRVELL